MMADNNKLNFLGVQNITLGVFSLHILVYGFR